MKNILLSAVSILAVTSTMAIAGGLEPTVEEDTTLEAQPASQETTNPLLAMFNPSDDEKDAMRENMVQMHGGAVGLSMTNMDMDIDMGLGTDIEASVTGASLSAAIPVGERFVLFAGQFEGSGTMYQIPTGHSNPPTVNESFDMNMTGLGFGYTFNDTLNVIDGEGARLTIMGMQRNTEMTTAQGVSKDEARLVGARADVSKWTGGIVSGTYTHDTTYGHDSWELAVTQVVSNKLAVSGSVANETFTHNSMKIDGLRLTAGVEILF